MTLTINKYVLPCVAQICSSMKPRHCYQNANTEQCILGSDTSVYICYGLLGCYIMQLCRWLPLLHRNLLSTTSGQKPFDPEDEGNSFLRNCGTHLANHTNSDSIRTNLYTFHLTIHTWQFLSTFLLYIYVITNPHQVSSVYLYVRNTRLGDITVATKLNNNLLAIALIRPSVISYLTFIHSYAKPVSCTSFQEHASDIMY